MEHQFNDSDHTQRLLAILSVENDSGACAESVFAAERRGDVRTSVGPITEWTLRHT
jgi:hypothetical protein